MFFISAAEKAGTISVSSTPAVPGPIAGAVTAGFDLGWRWSARLVATAAEERLTFRRNSHTSFFGSHCDRRHN